MENAQALTQAEQQLLAHLRARAREGLPPPTLDQLCQELGRRSRGSLHKLVAGLVAGGLVEPMQGRRRGLRLSPMASGDPSPGVALPILGRITAGRPLEAVVDATPVVIDPGWAGNADFALEVRGDSMRDAGILDGDLVFCRDTAQAKPGQVVVALIDGSEATLKRLDVADGKVGLIAANPDYPPLWLLPERVRIQGVMVGLLRRCG